MVVSNGSPDELDSPFYLDNERICKTFEAFISRLGGEVNGKYNAWSYHVIGKVKRDHEWIFQIKKATYTSGNLLLSSAYQSLHLAACWKCQNLKSSQPDFLLRKRTRFDWVRKMFDKNLRDFNLYPQFVFQSTIENHPIANQLSEMLSGIFQRNQVFSISYLKNELTIELRTDKIYESVIEQLIDI